MDNLQQIEEIRKFLKKLCSLTGRSIEPEVAAEIWIRKNAGIWRLQHPSRKLN